MMKKCSYLKDKISTPEIRDGSGQPGPAPDKSQEEGSLGRAELLHHLPEPRHQTGVDLYTCKMNVWSENSSVLYLKVYLKKVGPQK